MKRTIFNLFVPVLVIASAVILALNYGGRLKENFSYVNYAYADTGDGDTTGDANSPSVQQNIGGMFNERGYSTSNSSSFDENEVINDFNGNLQYSIPMYDIKGPGDMSLKMSINYNSNIAYIFIPSDLTHAYIGHPLPMQNFNAPGWILSVNGIAVQMINYETNMLTRAATGQEVPDENVRLLAQGYHLTDKKYNDIDEKDVITLLLGDGNVLRLENLEPNYSIGDYYSTNKGIYAKAKVTFIDGSEDMWDYCKNRRIRLEMGDGLTYLFEESYINYYDFKGSDVIEDGCANRPQVIKLHSIIDRFGNNMQLFYGFPDLRNKGREPLESIDLNWTDDEIQDPDIELNHVPGTGASVLSIANDEQGTYRFDMGGFTLDSLGTHRTYINKITNPLGKSINIGYENYSRKIINVKTSGNNFITVNLGHPSFNLKRMNTFTNYNGGKRIYKYKMGTPTITLPDPGAGTVFTHSDLHWGQGRDAFFNNMLSEKITKDKGSNDSLKIETFNYSFTDGGGTVLNDPIDTNDIYTTSKSITTTVNNYNETSPVFSWVKYYKNYQTYSRTNNREFADWPGEVKIYKEEHKKGITEFKTIDYSYITNPFGTIGEVFFKGPFVDTAVTETIGNVSRTSRFKYSHFQNYPFSGGDTASNPIQKKIEIDPLGLRTETSFKKMEGITRYYNNAYFGSDTSRLNALIYITGQPEYVKKYDKLGNLIYHEAYEYFENGNDMTGYIFQLKKKKVINPSNTGDFKEIVNEYYKNDTIGKHLYSPAGKPSTEGQLEKTTDPQGNVTRFYYHPVVINPEDRDLINIISNKPEIKYKKIFDNGSVVTEDTLWEDRRMPVRTDVYSSSGQYSSIYTQYDVMGNMIKIFDKNNFVNEFKFDALGRIISAQAPYDFNTGNDTSYYIKDTTYVPFEEFIDAAGWGYTHIGGSYFAGDHYALLNQDPLRLRSITPGGLPTGSAPGDIMEIPYFRTQNIKPGQISEIDSASMVFYPIYFIDTVDNQSPPDNYYLRLVPLEALNATTTINSASAGNDYKDISFADINSTHTIIDCGDIQENYPLYKNIVDIKDMLNLHLVVDNKSLQGFKFILHTTEPIANPQMHVELWLAKCINGNYANGMTTDGWANYYAPKIFVKGKHRVIDSSLVTVTKPSTLRYIYDDAQNKVTVFNKLQGSSFKKNEVIFDGFYRIKETKQFTGPSTFDSFKTEYNYLDQKSQSKDALNNTTKFSYDELGNTKRIVNADSSFTKDTVVFMDTLVTNLATYTGFVKKTSFADEESKSFEKYFDAVGNLVREVKFLDDPEFGGGESVPLYIPLITDYRYDSLYRVSQVRTPEGKNIFYHYDGFGRQTQRSTVDAGIEKFWFDRNDNLIISQDAKQRALGNNVYTERKYDGLNRLIIIGEGPAGGIQPIFDSLMIDDTLQTDNILVTEYLTVNVYDTLSSAPEGVTFTAPSGYYDVNNNTKGQLVATAFRTHPGDPWNYKFYRYDARGRVIKMWTKLDNLPEKKIEYTYNSQNQATNVNYQAGIGAADEKRFNYSYDVAGRLGAVSYPDPNFNPSDSLIDAPPGYINLTRYTYNANSNVATHTFDNNDITTGFIYNSRNWIDTTINNPYFRYGLKYFKNGNIKTQHIGGNYDDNIGADLNFTYTYDRSNRLLKQDLINGSDNTFTIENTYDKDGNILTLHRYGEKNNPLDEFIYDYYPGKNRLASVNPNIEAPMFQYDSSGNMTHDGLNGITGIKYDYRNLLTEFSKTISDTPYVTRYYYDEAGNRVKKIILKNINRDPAVINWEGVESMPQFDPNESTDIFTPDPDAFAFWRILKIEYYIREAAGKELAIYNGNSLDLWNIWGLDNIGKIENDGKPFFYLKDHLGSIHAVIDTTETIVSTQDFDMWGYELEGRTSSSQNAKYDFTSKERDTETGYNYFGARYYDSRIGRWGGVDKLHDKKPSITPYQYGALNPLSFIDPNGKDEIKIIVRSYIPSRYVWPATFIVITDGRGPLYNVSRDFVRTEQVLTIETDPNKSSSGKVSHDSFLNSSKGMILAPTPKFINAPASGEINDPTVIREGNNINFNMSGEAGTNFFETPDLITPSINYNFDFVFTTYEDGTIGLKMYGDHNGYPAYEVWVKGENQDPILVHDSRPDNDLEIFELMGFNNIERAGNAAPIKINNP